MQDEAVDACDECEVYNACNACKACNECFAPKELVGTLTVGEGELGSLLGGQELGLAFVHQVLDPVRGRLDPAEPLEERRAAEAPLAADLFARQLVLSGELKDKAAGNAEESSGALGVEDLGALGFEAWPSML